MTAPSILIALPHGLGVSGVVLWAVRLANAMAARGRGAGLIVHPEPPRAARLDLPFDRRVRVFRVPEHMGPLAECRGDLEPYLPTYRAAATAMAEATTPVVLSPNLLGDCYGLAAVLSREFGGRLRVVGWQHSDIEYDTRVLAHYEPMLAAFVAVSDRIETNLRARLASRAADVANIPYGVEVPPQPPRHRPARPPSHALAAQPSREAAAATSPGRKPWESGAAPVGAPNGRHSGVGDKPLRLLYAGRIEHHQKRILALPALAAELTRRGIDHELTIVGDGPAAAELDAAIRPISTIHRLPPASPAEVIRLFDAHDAFVLASRYEGLSVSMLEAMARGCVPIVTRTDSGATQAIDDGVNGLIAGAVPDADEPAAAAALADAVERFRTLDAAALSNAAWRTARDRYSIDHHTDRVEALLDTVAAAPARLWSAGRPAAFTAPEGAPGVGGAGSGSVPPDGPRRMAEVLARLAGRKVIIHGTGQHTRQLRDVILGSPAIIVAFTDDDRAKQGTLLWDRPIIAPDEAAATGATDVVISSWMHEEAVWARRDGYERGRMRLVRVYA